MKGSFLFCKAIVRSALLLRQKRKIPYDACLTEFSGLVIDVIYSFICFRYVVSRVYVCTIQTSSTHGRVTTSPSLDLMTVKMLVVSIYKDVAKLPLFRY